MKKLLIASAICAFPVAIFGLVNPIATIINGEGKMLNVKLFFFYMGILSICLSVIVTTTIRMLSYADRIDNLDKEEERLREAQRKANVLISNYNDLIARLKA